tara:strand:- start:2322 stop:2624 length:303 start_codon:yes stop_codon:yes gene_type:complete
MTHKVLSKNSATILKHEPGNKTRYIISVVDLGEEKQALDEIGCDNGSILVTLINWSNRPSVILPSNPVYTHPSYVSDKMGIGIADAEEVVRCISSLRDEG